MREKGDGKRMILYDNQPKKNIINQKMIVLAFASSQVPQPLSLLFLLLVTQSLFFLHNL